jgi:threonine/homoserine efflux transporter RhtA
VHLLLGSGMYGALIPYILLMCALSFNQNIKGKSLSFINCLTCMKGLCFIGKIKNSCQQMLLYDIHCHI